MEVEMGERLHMRLLIILFLEKTRVRPMKKGISSRQSSIKREYAGGNSVKLIL